MTNKNKKINRIILIVCAVVAAASIIVIGVTLITKGRDRAALNSEMERLREMMNIPEGEIVADGGAGSLTTTKAEYSEQGKYESEDSLTIQKKLDSIYEENNDVVGWLKVEGTPIDYPVMQTMNDEQFYLKRGFDKAYNENGCLFADTDSNVGKGTKEGGYLEGKGKPSSNIIIYGHTMFGGEMFGSLPKYKDSDYGKEHNIIKFDTLYETREYELIAVFYSQVYYNTDTCFKYYQFFEANNQAEFDDWYTNIKQMSLYDTGVTAEYGDEFITFSCCSYHTENGRFAVVGKRIK